MAIDASKLKKRLPAPPPADEGATGIEQAPLSPVLAAAPPEPPPPGDLRRRLDGRALRATGRIYQLNVKTTAETKEAILRLARERGMLVAEVIEYAIKLMETDRR